ncbi:MAG: ComF family protein [Chitinophagales bacterium]|nr:ComF family protein [Chitinophagales bacterium]
MKSRFLQIISDYVDDLSHIIYPNVCQNCSDVLISGEEFLCIKCLHKLPVTMFHRLSPNPVEKKLFGRIPIKKATSAFYYHKSNSIQKLLHKVKYKHKVKLCAKLGYLFALKLEEAGYFENVDMILPVPMHKSKFRSRGFNQCVIFAEELSKYSSIECSDSALKRVKSGKSQTKKDKYHRWKTISGDFICNDREKVEGKNILLIDDVITTGSTLEACTKAILNKTNAEFNIATFAYAD